MDSHSTIYFHHFLYFSRTRPGLLNPDRMRITNPNQSWEPKQRIQHRISTNHLSLHPTTCYEQRWRTCHTFNCKLNQKHPSCSDAPLDQLVCHHMSHNRVAGRGNHPKYHLIEWFWWADCVAVTRYSVKWVVLMLQPSVLLKLTIRSSGLLWIMIEYCTRAICFVNPPHGPCSICNLLLTHFMSPTSSLTQIATYEGNSWTNYLIYISYFLWKGKNESWWCLLG